MDARRESILVVDDDAALLGNVEPVLARAGFVPVTTRAGRGALEVAVRCHPRAILLDLRLPGLDGLDLLFRLRGMDAISATPVILMIVAPTPELVAEGFARGASDFLSKPFSEDELLTRLALAIRVARHRETALERQRLVETRLRDAEARVLLASGVAHDFNNALTAVVGYLEVALIGATDPLAGERRRHVEEALRSAELACALASKLLALGRDRGVHET